MFIPGQLISLITFPGVIVHEWSHKKFCDWFNVKVYEVAYFKFWGKIAGYVVHETPSTFQQVFYISVWPLIVNSFLCLALSITASVTQQDWWRFMILWLALSIGAHAFPSDQDARNILDRSKKHIKKEGKTIHYLSYPFFALIWWSNKLSYFWFDFIYAILLIQFGLWLL